MAQAKKGFLSIVNASPATTDIRKNEDGSEYIPISIIQSQLDQVFNGLWSWNFDKEFTQKLQMFGRGILSYKHPDSEVWLQRTGTAGITCIGDLKLDYPRLEAMALLSAAKKIGISFGRNLNRDKEDTPSSGIIDVAILKERDEAIDAMNGAEDTKQLAFVFNKYPKFHRDREFIKSMAARNQQLSLKEKAASNGTAK